jgi:hypothetical protein
LTFTLQPVLPAEWFTEKSIDVRWNEEEVRIPENSFACALMGNILLVYHNPTRQNTYGDKSVHPVKYIIDSQHTVLAPQLTGAMAEQVRQRTIRRIDVWLA